MNNLSILQAGPDPDFPSCLRGAVQLAFPGAIFVSTADWMEAMARPEAGPELLVLGKSATEGEAAIVSAVTGSDGLPRFGVIHPTRNDEGEKAESPDLPLMVQQLKWAAERHSLLRENAQLRGDLLTMARRVSHDLRTPLGGALATADLLGALLPEPETDAVKVLFDSIDEITKIINRTSFILRATVLPPPVQRVAMGVVVQETLMRLERIMHRKNATASFPEVWPEVWGVGAWLEVIWWNLLHNELEHSAHDPVLRAGWEREESGSRFWLHDQPGAWPPEQETPVFHPFHRLHDPAAPSGYGLAIVQRLAELQGGRCGHGPLPGGGRGFYFTLPDC